MQIVVLPVAARLIFELMNTVTESLPTQPFASCTLTVYVVVDEGNALVVSAVGVSSEAAGDQFQIVPPATVSCTVSPAQIVISGLANTVRLFPMLIVTESLFTQPLMSVPVTTYVVVTAGDAVGFAMESSLNPPAGVHT